MKSLNACSVAYSLESTSHNNNEVTHLKARLGHSWIVLVKGREREKGAQEGEGGQLTTRRARGNEGGEEGGLKGESLFSKRITDTM